MPALAVDMGLKAATVTEPENYRTDEYRQPVPATLKGAKIITADEASALWTAGSAVFIDVYPHAPKPQNLPAGTVWREPQHFSIENAKWLANTGYGVLSPEAETYFKTHLEALSGGDKTKPLVFFCLRNCWMSWNAGKRAMTYGYTNVIWFSEGTDAWQEIGQPVAEIKPEP
ncbi:MAG: PQQ-dependent catabolism-associated CXXCW motif protein [Hyphomicrobium sp.]